MTKHQIVQRFMLVCCTIIYILLFLYALLVLFPSYQSGLYLSSNPRLDGKTYNVPFYEADGAFFSTLGLGALLLSFFPVILVLFSIFMLGVLLVDRRSFSNREKVVWISSIIAWYVLCWLSTPAHRAFFDWLFRNIE